MNEKAKEALRIVAKEEPSMAYLIAQSLAYVMSQSKQTTNLDQWAKMKEASEILAGTE